MQAPKTLHQNQSLTKNLSKNKPYIPNSKPLQVSSNFESKHLPSTLPNLSTTLNPKEVVDNHETEVIRKEFLAQTELRGEVKMSHFNSKHVYIDLDNEFDHVTVLYIQGQLMRIQLWTPIFRPDQETPLVPVCVLLPELPWHCYCMEIIGPLLSPIGKALFLDLATYKKTRGSMAKVKIQLDLTKPRPSHVWLGFDEDENGAGKWQQVEYEGVPFFCSYCKHQGHETLTCKIKAKDDETKRRKEQEKKVDAENLQSTANSDDTTPTQKQQQPMNQQTIIQNKEKILHRCRNKGSG